MTVWAIADLHLAFGAPDKAMDFFGEPWIGYTDKIKTRWLNTIRQEDLVLIPGDISWAMKVEQARADLEWIHQLPGTKVLLRGNHDYWWSSLKQIQAILPPSMHLIQNNAFQWNNVSIAGSRLWDTSEYQFQPYINYIDNPRAKTITEEDRSAESKMIFQRELTRLETSLKALSQKEGVRIAMTHYPPIGGDLKESQTSALLEKYHVNICVFGHLHNVKKEIPLFGKKNEISYYLTSADYLDFNPLKIYE
jgi:uncharacterized protein